MSAFQAAPSERTPEPSLSLFHAAMLLSGFGTVFLGPLLPALAASAHATDSGSGLFFTAQFIGAFFGGITTSHRLYYCLVRGLSSATAGFMFLAFCAGLHAGVLWDAVALIPLGFGVGQMLTSVNLLAAHRFQKQRSSALSFINFTWSLGAVTAPFFPGKPSVVDITAHGSCRRDHSFCHRPYVGRMVCSRNSIARATTDTKHGKPSSPHRISIVCRNASPLRRRGDVP